MSICVVKNAVINMIKQRKMNKVVEGLTKMRVVVLMRLREMRVISFVFFFIVGDYNS